MRGRSHNIVERIGGALAERVKVPSTLAVPLDGVDARTAGGIGRVAPTALDLVATAGRLQPGDHG